MKKTLVIAALVVIAGVALLIAVQAISPPWGDLFDFFRNRTTVDHGPVILEAIKRTARLETVEMQIRTENVVEKKKGLCVDRVRYLGLVTVTAGIDLQKITASDIVITENTGQSPTVTITLPPATILHVTLDTERDTVIKEVEVKISLLCTDGSQMPQAILEAQNCSKADAVWAAMEKDILGQAEEHAGEVLKELLKKTGYPSVVIEYDQTDAPPEVTPTCVGR